MNTPIRHRGLTLVEASMAMAVLAIVAALAIPSFTRALEKRRLLGWAAAVAADLRLARTEAIVRNEPVRMTLTPQRGGACYLIHTGPAGSCRCGDGEHQPAWCDDASISIKRVWIAPATGIRVTSRAAGLLFDPQGTVTPAGTWTVAHAAGDEIRHVVNLLGRVRSCSASPLAHPGWRAC